MAYTLLRDRALQLRIKGASFNEIVQLIKAPKSTVRYWYRNIVLSEEQLRRTCEKQKYGSIIAAEQKRRKRIELTETLLQEGIEKVGELTERELLLVGAALYWAEGYRKGNDEFGFTNSDPRMIQVILQWLCESCGVKEEDIRARICINDRHKERIDAVQRFWAQQTQLPLSQFTKPTFIRLKNQKRYLNPSEHFGTLRVKLCRGTNLRRKILGFIEGIYLNRARSR